MEAERTFSITDKNLEDFRNALEKIKLQFEENNASIRIAGPFREAGKYGPISCELKLIHPGELSPDELHHGYVKGVSIVDGIRVTFQLRDFPDEKKFFQVENRLLDELEFSPKKELTLPKTEKTREEYKRAYAIIKQTQQAYRELWEKDRIDDPNPNLLDYRDNLINEIRWKRDPKTINKVIALGEAGLLD